MSGTQTLPRPSNAPRAVRSPAVPAIVLAATLAFAALIAQSSLVLNWPLATGLGLRIVESLAWLAGALLLIRLVDALVWERLVLHLAGIRMPHLLRQFVAVLLFILSMAAMLNQAWDLSIATVLATTGVLGLVLGLALRPVLTDLFCGIALNVEQPFRMGDFVSLRMRGQREPILGIVREVNWRATRVLTPEDNLISVPNSVVAAAVVENLSFPSPVSEQEVDIVLDWSIRSALIEQVLTAAVTEAWVLGATAGDKPPKLRISRLDGSGATYKIVYLLDPRRKPKGPAKHALLSSVQKHLRFAGLQPVQVLALGSPTGAPVQRPIDHDLEADRRHALEQVDLLAVLHPEERAALSAGVRVHRTAAGHAVVRDGDAGSSMFVVAAGVLEVLVTRAGDTQPQRVGVLGPGALFGEMSMLTGAPRSATVRTLVPSVLYEVTHEQMAALLSTRPGLAEALSEVVAAHQRRDAARKSTEPENEAAEAKTQTLAGQIAARIRRFFGH